MKMMIDNDNGSKFTHCLAAAAVSLPLIVDWVPRQNTFPMVVNSSKSNFAIFWVVRVYVSTTANGRGGCGIGSGGSAAAAAAAAGRRGGGG